MPEPRQKMQDLTEVIKIADWLIHQDVQCERCITSTLRTGVLIVEGAMKDLKVDMASACIVCRPCRRGYQLSKLHLVG